MELHRKIFRANDIRGIYPKEINEEVVFYIASALGNHFKKEIVIGRDTRLSSPVLYRALKRGLRKNRKLKIIDAGLITTPTMYFLVNHLKLEGGIVITASHNPKDHNGMKIAGKGAQLLTGEDLYKIVTTS